MIKNFIYRMAVYHTGKFKVESKKTSLDMETDRVLYVK